MSKLEKNLRKIKLQELSDDDKGSIWRGILLRRLENLNNIEMLSRKTVKIFSLHIHKFAVATFALIMVFTGAGVGVLSASNNALPGSALFSLNLAVEKLQIQVAATEKKDELRLKFAEERVEEVRNVSMAKATTVMVRAEPDGEVKEINTIEFSKEENAGVEEALNNLTMLLEATNDKGNADMIEKALQELLVLLGDDANLVVKRTNGVIKISANGTDLEVNIADEQKEPETIPLDAEEEILEDTKTLENVPPIENLKIQSIESI